MVLPCCVCLWRGPEGPCHACSPFERATGRREQEIEPSLNDQEAMIGVSYLSRDGNEVRSAERHPACRFRLSRPTSSGLSRSWRAGLPDAGTALNGPASF